MMDHQEFSAVLDKGMEIAAEHFAENELYICKGRRLEFESFSSSLNVSINLARREMDRTHDAEGTLNTLLTSLELLKSEYDKKLADLAPLMGKTLVKSRSKEPVVEMRPKELCQDQENIQKAIVSESDQMQEAV